jgi:alpha-tubulin suppressor-like RCC1 family protein
MIEYFKRLSITIVQTVISKFHTIFRDKSGLVYTCGHGKDGRLGHNNDETYMIPTLVTCLKDEKCIGIAASRNNSYFLMNDGVVKSCGTNEYKQLGQFGETKVLAPKPLNMKGLKGIKIESFQCGKFHCALLSSNNDVYTFGLNGRELERPDTHNKEME